MERLHRKVQRRCNHINNNIPRPVHRSSSSSRVTVKAFRRSTPNTRRRNEKFGTTDVSSCNRTPPSCTRQALLLGEATQHWTRARCNRHKFKPFSKALSRISRRKNFLSKSKDRGRDRPMSPHRPGVPFLSLTKNLRCPCKRFCNANFANPP